MDYYQKYLKYKNKYINLKKITLTNSIGGRNKSNILNTNTEIPVISKKSDDKITVIKPSETPDSVISKTKEEDKQPEVTLDDLESFNEIYPSTTET
jgi:hypothetical protein